jgi:hypothetical protein
MAHAGTSTTAPIDVARCTANHACKQGSNETESFATTAQSTTRTFTNREKFHHVLKFPIRILISNRDWKSMPFFLTYNYVVCTYCSSKTWNVVRLLNSRVPLAIIDMISQLCVRPLWLIFDFPKNKTISFPSYYMNMYFYSFSHYQLALVNYLASILSYNLAPYNRHTSRRFLRQEFPPAKSTIKSTGS